jgi:glycolate oxidase FAD binding subunit
MPLVRPATIGAIGDLVKQASRDAHALYPVGSGTKLALGNPPSRQGRVVDMSGLAGVIDFPARDMTITVQAGITIKALQELAASEKLQLPIDVAQPDRATLGGIIATNACGPRRLGYGTVRDYVIGISAVNDEGAEFKAGGRVVKNVAGYDLCKLLVGSLGTLGIITQATLKLRPLAEQHAMICVACDAPRLDAMLNAIHQTRTRPTMVDVLNRSAATRVFDAARIAVPVGPWLIVVGYEGNAEAVSWQMQQLVRELGKESAVRARFDYAVRPLAESLVELAAQPVTFKANLLPSATAAFCIAADEEPRTLVRAHAGNGIVYGHLPGDLTKEQAASMLTRWRQRGQTVVSACPSDWKASLDVWGPPPADVALMREVKRAFDPRGVFNPGRFVGCI